MKINVKAFKTFHNSEYLDNTTQHKQNIHMSYQKMKLMIISTNCTARKGCNFLH